MVDINYDDEADMAGESETIALLSFITCGIGITVSKASDT